MQVPEYSGLLFYIIWHTYKGPLRYITLTEIKTECVDNA